MSSRLVQVTPPTEEPVSLQLTKTHLSVDIDDTDTLIAGYISAARKYCEARSHLLFCTQTWDYFLDDWGLQWNGSSGLFGGYNGGYGAGYTIYTDAYKQNQLILPHGGVQSVTSVKYNDTNGTLQTWATNSYIVSLGTPARIAPVQNSYFPSLASQIDCVQVRYVAGTDAANVDQAIVSAILLVVERLYQARGAVSDVAFTEVPIGVDDLLRTVSCGNQYFA